MWKCSLVSLVLLVSVTVARGEEPLKLVRTIPLDGVKGRIDHMAVDVEGKRLYVAALGNDSMEVIDLAVGKRVHSIAGLKKPTGIRVLPGSRNVVVASGDDGNVRVFSPDLKLLGTVDCLDDADNVRLSPDGKLAYVGYGDGAIAIIDPQQFKKIGDIKLDGHPEAFQLETNWNRIFVNVPSVKQVAVIDREKNVVIAKWPLNEARSNFPMALDEVEHRLFVGCRNPAKILVLNTDTGKVVATIDCCGDTDDVFYDAAKKQIYATGGDGFIFILRPDGPDRYEVMGKIATSPGARTSAFDAEGKLLLVAVPERGQQRAEIRIFRPS